MALFQSPPPPPTNETEGETWTVLSVEDDEIYQRAQVRSLKHLNVLGRPLKIKTARSAKEGKEILEQDPNVAVILMDVIMETDDAGLKLVQYVRNVMGNDRTRIIIITGQPGNAPADEVLLHYDVDAYVEKQNLHGKILRGLITAHIRNWHHLTELNYINSGLSRVLSATEMVHHCKTIEDLCSTLLTQTKIITEGQVSRIIALEMQASHDTPTVLFDSTSDRKAANHKNIDFNSGYTAITQQKILNAIETPGSHFDKDTIWFSYPKTSQTNPTVIFLDGTFDLDKSFEGLSEILYRNIRDTLTHLMLQKELYQRAYVDQETQLHNRNKLLEVISVISEEDWTTGSLLFLENLQYDSIRTAFGKNAALQANQQMIDRLLALSNSNKEVQVARLNNDSFVAYINHSKLNRFSLADIQMAINQPYQDSEIARVTCQIAKVNLKDFEVHHAEEAIAAGEFCLSKFQRNGKLYLEFEPKWAQVVAERTRLLTELKRAIKAGDIDAYYQPKVNLKNDRLVGFEALARWRLNGEMIPPDIFIPLAESAGLIELLDIAVLKKAIKTQEMLVNRGITSTMSFNASTKSLAQDHYVQPIMQLITNIKQDLHLEVEVTETNIIEDFNDVIDSLMKLKRLNVQIALDDFGTGYSSLSYLHRLPYHTIKIDRTFVDNFVINQESLNIVEMIIELARRSKFGVVAEGIENEEQKQLLIKLGCFIGQGYLMSKPLPLEDAVEFALTHRAAGNNAD